MPSVRPNFSHLLSLSGPLGTFEHAEHTVARPEHGYCTDDVARALIVATREPYPDDDVVELARSSLRFLQAAQSANGHFRNRRRSTGTWFGASTSDDWWGRALWALGTTIARSNDPELHGPAHELFERGSRASSSWPRSNAFATLGAVEVLAGDPTNEGALRLINRATAVLDRREISAQWRWPEERLWYANAALPEALMATGSALGDDRLVHDGLRQLKWLLNRESRSGHLSVTPAGGRGPNSAPRRFDQQPIEVAAMSDACIRAFELTGNAEWIEGHDLAVRWFMGHNDVGALMYDPRTGGGYDGLGAHGANLNQGAESTIALLSTLQNAERFAVATS